MSDNSLQGIQTPEIQKANRESSDIRPKKVEQWIQELPLANIGETARQVYQRLKEMNRLVINEQNRLKLSEQLRPSIQYITKNLCQHFINSNFPLSEKGNKVAHLCRELNSEMAIGYKHVIKDITVSRLSILNKKTLTIAIHRSLRYFSQLHFQSAIIYETSENHFWVEVNQLYYFSEQNKLSNIPVKDSEFEKNSTIEDIYKQIILLSLSSPTHLKQSEIKQFFEISAQWVKHIELYKPEKDTQLATFIIHLMSNSPPKYTKLYGREINLFCRCISTKKLIQVLHNDLKTSNTEQNNFGNIERKVILHLLHHWSSPRKRQSPRNAGEEDIEVATGIKDIEKLILSLEKENNQQNQAQEALPSDWLDSSRNNLDEDDFNLNEIGLMPKGNEFENVPKFNTDNIWKNVSKNKEKKTSLTYPCRIIDESAGGYSLLWYTSNESKIRIGELIGIKSEMGKSCGIGILRWIQQRPDSGLCMGIQVLAQKCQTVTVTTTNDGEKAISTGIIFQNNIETNANLCFITNNTNHRKGSILTIKEGDNNYKIRLMQLVEKALTFKHYSYVDLEARSHNKSNQSNENSDDFDSVWSLL
ncbi:MAG: hypothetical protein HN826_02815 [Methylococcales bacterium]|nr:hypothetical protein [Methylococcales bacterium]